MDVHFLQGLLLPILLVLGGCALFIPPHHLIKASERSNIRAERQPPLIGRLMISAGTLIGGAEAGRPWLVVPWFAQLVIAAHVAWLVGALLLVRRLRSRGRSGGSRG